MTDKEEGEGGETTSIASAARALAKAFGRGEDPGVLARIAEKVEDSAGTVLGVLERVPDMGVGARAAKAVMGEPAPNLGTSRAHTSGTTGPDMRESVAGAPNPPEVKEPQDFAGAGGYVYRKTPEGGVLIVKSPGGRVDGLVVKPEGGMRANYDAIMAEMNGAARK